MYYASSLLTSPFLTLTTHSLNLSLFSTTPPILFLIHLTRANISISRLVPPSLANSSTILLSTTNAHRLIISQHPPTLDVYTNIRQMELALLDFLSVSCCWLSCSCWWGWCNMGLVMTRVRFWEQVVKVVGTSFGIESIASAVVFE